MRYYIATSLNNAAEHEKLQGMLAHADWQITYDWTRHGSVQSEGVNVIRKVALAEVRGVRAADVVIVLLPGGRGTHCELGMALALGKPVYIVADPKHGFFANDKRTCAFYHHPLVYKYRFNSIEKLVGWLFASQADEVEA